MNPHCICPISGHCPRHNMHKGPELHRRCRGQAPSRDCGLAYWIAWEQGRLGATAPDDPILNPDSFCSSTIKSSIGSRLSEIIKRETGIEVPCESCRAMIESLNSMNQEEAVSVRERVVDDIVSRAPEQAQTLIQSLGIVADRILGTGILRQRVASWFDEAVNLEESLQKPQYSVKKKKEKKAAGVAGGRLVGIRSCFKQGKDPVRFIKSSQFQQDILKLVGKLPPDITAVAGVARSGLSAATMVSMYLHLPLIVVRQTKSDIVSAGNGWRLGGADHINPSTDRVVVIDDTCMTGNSFRSIGPLCDEYFKNYITASVYCNPLALHKPNLFAVSLPWPHLLEWNLFNSILTPTLAVDFDGVLCHDCPIEMDDDGTRYEEFIRTATPLYVPRKSPIPLIVTARIEKYRTLTEDWLSRHRIRWERLVMHPAKTLRERMSDDIPAYKARHFVEWKRQTESRGPGPHLFVESEDSQARRIAHLSRLTTICPHTGAVYQ